MKKKILITKTHLNFNVENIAEIVLKPCEFEQICGIFRV